MKRKPQSENGALNAADLRGRILAAAMLTVLCSNNEALARDIAGAAVDTFCSDFNGSTPYADEGCFLCHSVDFSEYIAPSWDWYYATELQNFCAATTENTAPTLFAIGNHSAVAGAELAFNLFATDIEGDSLSFSASGLPDGAVLEANAVGGASFSWTPSGDQIGEQSVTVTVSDGTRRSAHG